MNTSEPNGASQKILETGKQVMDGARRIVDGDGITDAPRQGAALKKTIGIPSRPPSEMYNTGYLTTNTGAPVGNNDHSLTVGREGPVLMEDYHLMEKIGQFDREKTPERVVHARGMVAKGYFEVTHDISHLTCANFLSKVGKKTPVAARFSTVTHERGSPESLRDVRGFSVKMYTEEGNWDFVGNNIPVFFIRDGMKFPDLVHALRPNPRNHIQEGWRILDFLSHHPESTNILTWLLDDNGIPANWRALEGYGVNSFILINKEGKEVLCKFHFRPEGGAKTMTDEEAMMVGEGNMRHSHATHDLYNAINSGDYPEWDFFVQIMEYADKDKFYFDPEDCTKVWPEDEFPLIPVGKMVMDQNIDNFHAESEQIAFQPGAVIPGIAFSNDKVLQSRIFSYGDTQRYRIGVNYQMLPINQPMCPFHNNHHDGAMNFMHRNEEVNYYPSVVEEKDAPHPGYTQSTRHIEGGKRVKMDISKSGDDVDFRQAGERYRTFDEERKGRFQKHVLQWMTDPKCTEKLRDIWMGYWEKVDGSLSADLKAKIAEEQPSAKKEPVGATKA